MSSVVVMRIRIRIRIRIIPLMRNRILIFIWWGLGFLFHVDPDPTFHPAADPDSDPRFQVKTQTLEKVLNYAHIPYVWLVICNVIRIRFRIQLITLMWIRILIFILCGCGLFYADEDWGYQNDADPDPKQCLWSSSLNSYFRCFRMHYEAHHCSWPKGKPITNILQHMLWDNKFAFFFINEVRYLPTDCGADIFSVNI